MKDHLVDHTLIKVSWTPWSDADLPSAGLTRPFLILPAFVKRAHLSPPPADLPVVWRSNEQVCFELPLPAARAGAAELHELELKLELPGEKIQTARLVHKGGVERAPAVSAVSVADSGDETATVVALSRATRIAEALVSGHVEGLNDLVFPLHGAQFKPEKAEGLTIVPWGWFDKEFWGHDDSRGPMRLIVRIAMECISVLDRICERPRRVLRRERHRVRLDRVQQMDDACIRWFVRQPGRTILEKAGPAQSVMSVVRIETADTPENRVVRDFLERCHRESDRYLRENLANPQAYRVLLVRRFRNRIRSWLRRSELRMVPMPVGVPQPNYVLQFDDRYRQVWYWYERLRRKQAYEDDLWRWQHRTWAEHVELALTHALSKLQGVGCGFMSSLYIRPDQQGGRFIDPRSPIGAWVLANTPDSIVELYTQRQLIKIAHVDSALKSISVLGPDCVAVRKRPFDSNVRGRIFAIWSALTEIEDDTEARLRLWFERLCRLAGDADSWKNVTPVLLLPRPTTSGNSAVEPILLRINVNGMLAIGIAIPIPLRPHLHWLSDQISQLVGGVAS